MHNVGSFDRVNNIMHLFLHLFLLKIAQKTLIYFAFLKR